LNESPCLDNADYGQDRRKYANYASPPENVFVKIWIARAFLCLALAGSWVGVWSAVFWDGLGRWRWPVSGLGWMLMLLSLFQGLALSASH
jgi:hypothetical protein